MRLLRPRLFAGFFGVSIVAVALAGSSAADKTYVVVPTRFVASSTPSPFPAVVTAKLAAVTKRIKDVLQGNDYSVTAPSDAASAYGTNADFIIVPTVNAVFPTASTTSPTPAPVLSLSVTMQEGRTFATVGTVTGIDISSRSNEKVLSAQEILAIFQAQKPPRHPSVVVYNEGSRDERTANTAFSGPAYVEARLLEGLQYQKVDAMPAAEFLSSNGNATIISGTSDEILARICAVDPAVHVLSYVVIYEQTTNPLFGTQNASAHLHGNFRACGSPDVVALDEDGKSTFLGNQGLLFPQYFQLLNYALSAGRKNKHYVGLLGTSGVIASALLPNVPATAAEQTAVGDTARRMSCRVSLFFFQSEPGKLVTSGEYDAMRGLINRGHDPCLANDIAKRSAPPRRQAREAESLLYHLPAIASPAPSLVPLAPK